jgi:transposase InsO family protein
MPITATRSRRLFEELRAATLESRLEELGVLRSFSRPRVSNDNPYSESLFRTAKYRPDYPSNATAVRPSRSVVTGLSSTNRHAKGIHAGGHNRRQTRYVDDGCLNGSRSFIFPGSYRHGFAGI